MFTSDFNHSRTHVLPRAQGTHGPAESTALRAALTVGRRDECCLQSGWLPRATHPPSTPYTSASKGTLKVQLRTEDLGLLTLRSETRMLQGKFCQECIL